MPYFSGDKINKVSIYPVDGDKSRVLLDIDVPTLMLMFSTWAASDSSTKMKETIKEWGFSDGQARMILDGELNGQYQQIKEIAIGLFKDYVNSLAEQDSRPVNVSHSTGRVPYLTVPHPTNPYLVDEYYHPSNGQEF